MDQRALDQFIQAMRHRHALPGIALALIPPQGAPLLRAYGFSRCGERITPDTSFFIGSVSKSFTALAALQLVEAGHITLDTSIQAVIPEFTLRHAPDHAAQITVRHLLHHTSGLSDAGYPEHRLPLPADLRGLTASLSSARSTGKPGLSYRYFNPNYNLLGRLIEVVSGLSFAQYLERHIFAPLGMTATTVVPDTAAKLAQGHLILFGLALPCRRPVEYLAPAGGVISTALDMAAYLQMQMRGGVYNGVRLLSEDNIRQMHTPDPMTDSGYGMGWYRMATSSGSVVIGHSGDLSGFHAEIGYLPEHGSGYVALLNCNHALASRTTHAELVDGLVCLLQSRPARIRQRPARLTGAYFGAATLLLALGRGRQLMRVAAWARAANARPWMPALSGIALPLTGIIPLLALPHLVLWRRGRAVNLRLLFDFFPDAVVLLVTLAFSSVLLACLRLVYLLRGRTG